MGQSVTAWLPGGWAKGDVAYYAAANQSLPSGDQLRYGASGKVVGRALVKDGKDDHRVAVLFSGNTEPIACFTEALMRTPPSEELPGGWRVGDAAVYTGDDKVLKNGDRLHPGVRCQVVGPAPQSRNNEVAVLCKGHTEPVLTSSLARETSCWGDCTWCSIAPNKQHVNKAKDSHYQDGVTASSDG
eukprot:CAMPEP_0171090808 /NCGR_PEP_ID=MMETSP0766_2-20121228/32072_1 /TAXON_ID=439317 /ORGANISM="Gambierdiscus australes, Strain CAWD 149" /LENGTH=185 /DNA_ID=CAMNT_0011548841 /DNA_START=91 /DNA_END=648 /DNA_ORIENTATION=+